MEATISIIDHCLIGRILTDKRIRFKHLQERSNHLWQPGKGVEIIPVDQEQYLFQFYHKIDAEKVLNGEPWFFENFNIVLQKIAPGAVLKAVALDKWDIWAQVHDLPFGFIQEKVDKSFGAFLGELKAYDPKITPHRRFMRLRVRIDVNSPSKKEMNIDTPGGVWITAKFKYQIIGTFSFLLAVLGHTDKTCANLFEYSIIM